MSRREIARGNGDGEERTGRGEREEQCSLSTPLYVIMLF